MKRPTTLILTAFICGIIFGTMGAFYFFSPRLREAYSEIEHLNQKLELIIPGETEVNSTRKDEAPDFTLIDINGNNFTLSNMRGKVVLLDFMSTTCSPCQASMPDLVKLYEEMGEKVVMVSISIYPNYDTDEVLSEWMVMWDSKWIYARDTEVPPIAQSYWVRAIPTYVIIDQSGYIQHRNIGRVPLNSLKSEINSLLKP